MKYNAKEFYPTPAELLDAITAGFDWYKVSTVLEPEAGKGDIAAYVKEQFERKYSHDFDIDCIEIDPELRAVLKEKDFRVVHDDFLTFSTFKEYDLIIMNPPFSTGEKHLLKALEIQKNGGYIVCILNAETLRNPFSNERKDLVMRLEELQADIQYISGAFLSAERPTGVEIAVVKVCIPKKERHSFIFEDLQKKVYAEHRADAVTDLAVNDFARAMVQSFNIEVESGIRLIEEYKAMCPHILHNLRDNKYNSPILVMKVSEKGKLSINDFVKAVREKYWTAILNDERFTGNMTSNLREQYRSQVIKLKDYDFSYYNIKCIQLEMSRSLVKGIEDCIVELFDELSHEYSYYDECSNNIHYYNGWKTNKAWIINKKVILPCMNAFSSWSGKFSIDYHTREKLMDIERALNYLDGGLTEGRNMHMWLDHAEKTGQTKKIQLKYFLVTFYKKGTCHIEFTNEELLKKLNIFGSQQKKWLPPGYGKKTYQQMAPEEQAVIDEFEGRKNYDKTLAKADYYIYDPKSSLPLLEELEIA